MKCVATSAAANRHRADAERPARAKMIRDPAGHRRDRRAAERHRETQRHHTPAHRRLGRLHQALVEFMKVIAAIPVSTSAAPNSQ